MQNGDEWATPPDTPVSLQENTPASEQDEMEPSPEPDKMEIALQDSPYSQASVFSANFF